MVKIEVYRCTDVGICRFGAKGHSGFAAHGEDIVCAAVSVLLQTAVIGLEKWANAQVNVEVSDGNLQCRIVPGTGGEIEVNTILETLLLGLRAIEEEYGDFIQVSEIGV
ncbi:MAG: ribosomal-processing cysteine protease Prp [Firmicutes bacterium]|nr:ribosomal-processing cysteine protease Prp [Bacillota bacterium]